MRRSRKGVGKLARRITGSRGRPGNLAASVFALTSFADKRNALAVILVLTAIR